MDFRQLLSARLSELEAKLLADFDECITKEGKPVLGPQSGDLVHPAIFRGASKQKGLQEVTHEQQQQQEQQQESSQQHTDQEQVCKKEPITSVRDSDDCGHVGRSGLTSQEVQAASTPLNVPRSGENIEECNQVKECLQVPRLVRSTVDGDEAEGRQGLERVNSFRRTATRHCTADSALVISQASEGAFGSGPLAVLPVWQKMAFAMPLSFRGTSDSDKRRDYSQQSSKKLSFSQSHLLGGHNSESYFVDPSSMKNIVKELVGLLFIAYDFFVIPLKVFDPLETPFLLCMSWLTRLFWTVDIMLCFITGHITREGVAEMRPVEIFRHYSRTWLFFDLICTSADWTSALLHLWPGQGPQQGWSMSQSVGNVARLLRVLRTYKCLQIGSYIWDHIRSAELRLVCNILGSMVLMFALAHLVACAWYLQAMSQDGQASWLEVHHIVGEAASVHYVWALHWSIALFPGEALIAPASHRERVFGLVVLSLFFVVAAMFVSNITTSMTHLQIITSKESSQFATLRCYLADNQISRRLTVRIQKNARHEFAEGNRNTLESNVELLSLISSPLRAELHFEVHSPALLKHPFFESFCEHNLQAMQQISHRAVKAKSIPQGDVLFSENETPLQPRVLFVVNGTLEYTSRRDSGRRTTSRHTRRCTLSAVHAPFNFVTAGCWVCEAVLWTRWIHRGKLTAKGDCRLLELDASIFAQVCEAFPSEHPVLYANEFVNYLNENFTTATDLPIPEMHYGRLMSKAFPDPDDDEHSAIPSRLSWTNALNSASRTKTRRSSAISRCSSSGSLGEPHPQHFRGTLTAFASNVIQGRRSCSPSVQMQADAVVPIRLDGE